MHGSPACYICHAWATDVIEHWMVHVRHTHVQQGVRHAVARAMAIYQDPTKSAGSLKKQELDRILPRQRFWMDQVKSGWMEPAHFFAIDDKNKKFIIGIRWV